MCRNLLLALACSLAVAAAAQPTWRFHLAFEDGTGARDTIWFVFDTTATNSAGMVDEHLGEGAVDMDLSVFNVWLYNQQLDSTKTGAVPYWGYFPYLSAEIQAFNYTYPITLRWDTSLFHAPGLPSPGYFPGAQMQCNYFFGVPEIHVFDMMSNDTTTVAIDLFPLTVNIGTEIGLGLVEQATGSSFTVIPNPALDRLSIIVPQTRGGVLVRDLSGKVCLRTPLYGSRMEVDISRLTPGFYFLQLIAETGDVRTTNFIKR